MTLKIELDKNITKINLIITTKVIILETFVLYYLIKYEYLNFNNLKYEYL